jgi:hypothetical protein
LVNSFSITKTTSTKNCKVICEDNLITVNTNSHFNKALPHGEEKIMSTEFFSNTEWANLVLKNTTYADLHQKLGHPYKLAVIDTAKYYGIIYTSTRMNQFVPSVHSVKSEARVWDMMMKAKQQQKEK